MKAVVAIILLVSMTCGFAAAPPSRVDRSFVSGKEYLRVDQWARANGFQWKWLSRNDFLLWNGSSRVQFTADSKKMLLNGTVVLLSEAARSQNNIPYVAAIDFTTAVQPILFPPRNRPRVGIKHICIDPGHGGKEPGYLSGREQEKKYTLLLALELGDQLQRAGYTVSYTRTTDTLVEWPVRPEIARRRGADLFISLHFNSAGYTSSEVRGVEVYCMTPQRASSTNDRGESADNRPFAGNINNAKNMLLAYEIDRAVVRGAGMEDRGVKRARYWVLRDADMPAVLVEGGFLSNPAEAKQIFSAAWRKQLAQSIVSGINNYRKTVAP